MRIKQILTSKWGWAGAIIYPLLMLGLLINQNSLVRILYSPVLYLINLIPNPDNLELGILLYLAVEGVIVAIILGFIFGLIAEKIWRKFK